MWIAALTLTLSIAARGAAEPWRCSGPLVPPNGYEQDIAFADDATSAMEAARLALTRRVCQGSPCADLAARVAIWLTGQGDGRHCAMAVLDREIFAEWQRSQNARSLHTTLLEPLGKALLPGGAQKTPVRVAVGKVGGESDVPRWLRGQLVQALSAIQGVEVVSAAARGVAAVDADAVERQEQQRAVIDFTITVTRPDGTVKAVGASVPRAAVPAAIDDEDRARQPEQLALTVVAHCERRTGEFSMAPVRDCAQTPLTSGDRVRLSVTPSAAAHLYVMAYNSRGQFQMLFPAPGEDNVLEGDSAVTVPGTGWMELDDVKDVTEHLVVVAATARQGHLELLRGVDIPPRTGLHNADALVRTRGFLGEVRARGFKMPPPTVKADDGPSTTPTGRPVVERGRGIAAVELTFAHR
jgi:hypothetical protein